MTTAGPTRAEAARLVRPALASVLCGACLILAGCTRDAAQPPPEAAGIVGWRSVGSWSGSANLQTETFTSDTGSFRVHWQAKSDASPTSGSLHVIFRSADSGNPIIDAVNQRGAGEGIASVSAERPRWYYLTIESSATSWTVRVEEPVFGRSAPVGQ
jgi:hypothetical protein